MQQGEKAQQGLQIEAWMFNIVFFSVTFLSYDVQAAALGLQSALEINLKDALTLSKENCLWISIN